MKHIALSAILFSSTANVYASTDLNAKSACAHSAHKHLTAIMRASQSADDMKYFEIRKMDVTKLEKGSNGEAIETYTMIFGYKTGELKYENYEVQLVEGDSMIPGVSCKLISYEAKF